jgi:hypothetical protein
MQTIVIVGMLFYSLSYLATAILLRDYVSKETNRSKAFDVSDRRFQVNAINLGVALIVMAITYFSIN